MTNRQEFNRFLWEALYPENYVWLNPSIPLDRDDSIPEILLPAKSVEGLLRRMRKEGSGGACRASFRFHATAAVFDFSSWTYSINFVHKMVSHNLFFLSEEEVLARRVRQRSGRNLPCLEHLLEYGVLRSFLLRQGVSETDFRYFKDFHILVQEDLIEFFNDKYGTSFRDMYDLTEYRPVAQRQIIQRLKELPLNRLTRTMRIHWHNFLGHLRREARMI
ncbi:MAG: hypothetical protein AAFW73_11415 [Bacteroidota bacterium]